MEPANHGGCINVILPLHRRLKACGYGENIAESPLKQARTVGVFIRLLRNWLLYQSALATGGQAETVEGKS
jgi:hypothetical protein